MRKLWIVLLAFIPPCAMKNAAYRRLLGYKVGSNVKIGLSYIDAEHAEFSDCSSIGNFNRIKELHLLSIGEKASIGNKNRIVTKKALCSKSTFVLGNESRVTHEHYFDMVDDVIIGSSVVIGGLQSQFWTHGFDIERNRIQSPIVIMDYCYLGSMVIVNPGVSIAARNIIGSGAVVTKSFEMESGLIGGNPARFISSQEPLSQRNDVELIINFQGKGFYRKSGKQASDRFES